MSLAKRIGKLPEDPLSVPAAAEKPYYPSFTLKGEGMGMTLFDYAFSSDPETGVETGIVGSREQTRPVDHSYMAVCRAGRREPCCREPRSHFAVFRIESVRFRSGRKYRLDL